MIKAQTDLFLTVDKSRVVAGDDPAATFLLARAGQEIPDSIARQYGLDGSADDPAEDPTNMDPDGDGADEGGPEGEKKAFSSPPATRRTRSKKK